MQPLFIILLPLYISTMSFMFWNLMLVLCGRVLTNGYWSGVPLIQETTKITVLYNHLLFSDILRMAGVDYTYGFWQVSENWWVLQIQTGRGIVTQDPGKLKRNKSTTATWCLFTLYLHHLLFGKDHKLYAAHVHTCVLSGEMEFTYHRILWQVVVSASSDGVQLHQILKIGDFSAYPFLFNTSASDRSNLITTIQIIKTKLYSENQIK